jgi:hypothetical protein
MVTVAAGIAGAGAGSEPETGFWLLLFTPCLSLACS